MLSKRMAFIATIIAFYYVNIYSQTSLEIPSPNASSLGKFVDMPVSLFTGIPNINIPLYEIKEGNFSMPISLSYHATAFNPNEVPGWVGQGWALNAGGVITRKMRGWPDDYNYYVAQPYNILFKGVYFNQVLHPKLNGTYSNLYSNGDEDLDEFVFNFNGCSGKFVFDRSNPTKIIVVGNSGLKIEVCKDLHTEKFSMIMKNDDNLFGRFYSLASAWNGFGYPENRGLNGNFQTIKGFKITTPDGLQYEFGCKSDDVSSEMGAVERSKDFSDYTSNLVITNSWYLVRVLSANSKELVNFTYEQCGWSNNGPLRNYPKNNLILNRGVSYKRISSTKNFCVSLNGTMIYPCYLKQIKTPNQTIDFTIQESNELIANYQDIKENIATLMPDGEYGEAFQNIGLIATTLGSQRPNIFIYDGISNYQLNDISISNSNQTQIKKYKFSYTSNKFERLRLLKLEEEGKNPYLFDYYNRTNRFITKATQDTEVPIIEYANLGVDAWGFYNGDEAPEYLKIFNANPNGYQTGDLGIGAYAPYQQFAYRYNYYFDRNQVRSELQMKDLEYSLSQYSTLYNNSTSYNFCLKKIIYPTTGYTNFEYEPHSYSYYIDRASDGNISIKKNNEELITGGLRIKNIEFYNSETASLPSLTRHYTYDMGILSGIPQYYANQIEYYEFHGDIITGSSLFDLNPIMPMCSNGNGSYIGYSKVTETDDRNGRTEYFFSNYKDHPSLYSQSELNEGKDLHLDTYNNDVYDTNVWSLGLLPLYAKFPVTSFERERGLEIAQNIYDESNTLKREERNYFSKPINFESYSTYTTCLKSLSFEHLGYYNHIWISLFNIQLPLRLTEVVSKDYSIYYFPINLSKKIITDHYLSNNIKTEFDYIYSNDFTKNISFMSSDTQINSNGNKSVKNYTNIFASYLGGNNYSEFKTMYDKHMIFKPVCEETYKVLPDNSKYLIGGLQIKYKDFGNSNYQPSEIYKFNSVNPIIKTSEFLTDGYGYTGFKIDNYIDSYDDMGNMLQFTNKSDIKESYYWAYNKTNPIIKATNINYESLSTAVTSALQQLGKANINELTIAIGNMTDEVQRSLWKSFVDKILIHPLCTSAQITFYSYVPLIGISSVTNQQGISTYYEYDSSNRLKCTRDAKGSVINSYDYNYQK